MSGLAGCSQSGTEANGPDRPDVDDYLADGYDGLADATGDSAVTVTVGGGDGSSFVSPAVVRIDARSSIRWEWRGTGGTHDVRAADGSFGSGHSTAVGTTFEGVLDAPTVVKYGCVPRQTSGMKGVVIVD